MRVCVTQTIMRKLFYLYRTYAAYTRISNKCKQIIGCEFTCLFLRYTY